MSVYGPDVQTREVAERKGGQAANRREQRETETENRDEKRTGEK